MSKETEEICIQRFLNWYNEQYKRRYVHQRAEAYFPHLAGGLRWEFVVFERGNSGNWIGIEIKELATTREVSMWFEFWKSLCSDLTQALAERGVQGKLGIIHPPVVNLKSKERIKLLETFVEILAGKESILKAGEFTDIGPDIGDKFASWPRDKIRNHGEYRKWGEYRPRELLIKRSPDSICEVTVASSPIVARDGVKIHRQTFEEADIKHADKQLKLAKQNGAKETILLFACRPFIYPDLIKNEVQDLDHNLIAHIDYIYLVGMGHGEDRVVKIYPN